MAACDFDMRFTYVLAGWEGSIADGFLFSKAVDESGLVIPEGKFYLADAGFATTTGLLLPYRGVRYHLREWAQGNQKPQNRNELYNLRHSSARNVIERVFGVMKRRFKIIREGNSYDLMMNAKIVSALAAIHNFIRTHDFGDVPEPWNEDDDDDLTTNIGVTGGLRSAAATTAAATQLRDTIANAMWEQYSAEIESRRARRRDQAQRRRAATDRARRNGQIVRPPR